MKSNIQMQLTCQKRHALLQIAKSRAAFATPLIWDGEHQHRCQPEIVEVQMSLPLFWRAFLIVTVAWNLLGGIRMLVSQREFLGELASAGPPSLFLSLCGLLLLVLAGVTVLILLDTGRYWPLSWFAAAGRTAAGATMMYYLSHGLVPDRIVIPALVDIVFGLGFAVLAMQCAGRRFDRTAQQRAQADGPASGGPAA